MRRGAFLVATGLVMIAKTAEAQQDPPPMLPPPDAPAQGTPMQTPPPPQYYPPPQAQVQVRPPPPPMEYEPPPPPVHAPKYSLWLGARAAYMGFGFSFYQQRDTDHTESTGNFVGSGLATELNLGARLAHRYIPYVFYEHGFMGQGHRFEGSGATSSTDFFGLGFRFGGSDEIGFVSDISVGKRIIRVSNGNESYSMSGLEIFKLGLGAEFRLQTLFTLEVMATVSGGTLNDTSGDITFSAEGSKDGRTHPDFKNGDTIGNSNTTYVNLTLGVGIHFDVFGK